MEQDKYADIGYESGTMPQSHDEPEEENQVYTPLQMEYLDKFAHIHEKLDQIESNGGDNIGWFMNMKEGEKPKKENLVFLMDMRLIRTLHYIATNMYAQWRDNPEMCEALSFIMSARKSEKKLSTAFEVNELQAMWEKD